MILFWSFPKICGKLFEGYWLGDELFRRRQRMLRLLAIGNGLKVVVETISKEFNVPKKTIYSDHIA